MISNVPCDMCGLDNHFMYRDLKSSVDGCYIECCHKRCKKHNIVIDPKIVNDLAKADYELRLKPTPKQFEKFYLGEVTDEFKNCNSLSGATLSIGDNDDHGERMLDSEIEHSDEPDFWNN